MNTEYVAVAAVVLIVGIAVSMVFGACAKMEKIKQGEVMYKSILITGGTGFFSQAFVRQALAQNLSPRICIFSRDEYKQALMREALGNDSRLRFFIGDVRDRDRLRRAMEGVDLVIHSAALKRVEVGENNPIEMVKTNVMGSMNVIEAAIDAGVARVVALSTDKACEPANAYGASKLMMEKLFLAANNISGAGGTRFAVSRYGNISGSTGSVIPTWRAAGDKLVTLTDPDATRFYMTIQHAVRLVLGVAGSMKGGELKIPNLPAYRLGDLAEAMGVKVGRITGLGAGEKKHESMIPGETSEHARRMTVDELREAISHA